MTTAKVLVDHNNQRIRRSHTMKSKSSKIAKSRRGGGLASKSSARLSKQNFKDGRLGRHEALRAHRERLAKTAQDTFHTVLTTQAYRADGRSDSDDDSDADETRSRLLKDVRYYDLTERINKTRAETSFYPHYSPLLAGWKEGPTLSVRDSTLDSSTPGHNPEPSSPIQSTSLRVSATQFQFTSSSILKAARKALQSSSSPQKGAYSIGILNPASPKRPGGASLNGGVTLEECLVRQTTLFDSLQNSIAGAEFYAEHRKTTDGSGLHDHAMLYSPGVTVIKDDRGKRIAPFSVNIISSVPVHVGTVRAKFTIDDTDFQDGVRGVMYERMARALRLFEERGDRILILGAFGVGQSCNSPDMIGEIWADLLCARGAKFQGVFDRVVFALPAKHRAAFEKSFNAKVLEADIFGEDF